MKTAATIAIIRPPYKIQNPSEPRNTLRNTPQILLQNRNTEKIRKIYEIGWVSPIFGIFSVFRFWRRIWGVFRSVLWGSEGFCILYGGRMIAKQQQQHQRQHKQKQQPSVSPLFFSYLIGGCFASPNPPPFLYITSRHPTLYCFLPNVLDVGHFVFLQVLLFVQPKQNSPPKTQKRHNNTDSKTIKTTLKHRPKKNKKADRELTDNRGRKQRGPGINSWNRLRKWKRKMPDFLKTQMLFSETLFP